MTGHDDIWTDEELAVEWKCDVRLIQKMCREGRIASFKAGRSVRVTDRAKVAYEDRQSTQVAS